MSSTISIVLATAVLTLTAPVAASAGQFVYRPLTYQDYTVSPLGISDHGSYIVGEYIDRRNQVHGLYWNSGISEGYRRDASRGGSTFLFGVNDFGVAVGSAGDIAYWLNLRDGTEAFPWPASSQLVAVNERGVSVGEYSDRRRRHVIQGITVDALGEASGFVVPDGWRAVNLVDVNDAGVALGAASRHNLHPYIVFTYRDAVRRLPATDPVLQPQQITGKGDIVGNQVVLDGSGHAVESGAVVSQRVLTSIKYPGAGFTHAIAMDSTGAVYGTYGTVPGTAPVGSFVKIGDSYFPLAAPGADQTLITRVNPDGVMIGIYFVRGVQHAFLATCAPSGRPCTQ